MPHLFNLPKAPLAYLAYYLIVLIILSSPFIYKEPFI